MSVVTGRSRRRWATVAIAVVGLVVLTSQGTAALAWVGGGSGPTTDPTASALAALVMRSAAVPYTALAEVRGGIGLPDLPYLSDVAAELGGTTRARVWWASASSWRVAVPGTTGEQAVYRSGSRLVQWDYEESRLTDIVGSVPVRLPRVDDLLPPQAARWVLADDGPTDRVTRLVGTKLVAGVTTVGLGVTPGDPHSTIGRIEIWVDPTNGLPLQLEVVDLHGSTALESSVLDLTLHAPAAQDVAIPSAPGAIHDSTTTPDLASHIQQVGFWQLPDSLAGLASGAPVAGGTATYGSGLARFAVLPLSRYLSGAILDALRTGGGTALHVTGGEAVGVSSGLLSLEVSRGPEEPDGGPRHAYLLIGLVSPTLLTQATQHLLADPPPPRKP